MITTDEALYYVAGQMKKLGVEEESIISVIYELLKEEDRSESSPFLTCDMKKFHDL